LEHGSQAKSLPVSTYQNRNSKSLEEKKDMSRHIQFESGMSLTGTNADVRLPIKPSEDGLAIINLYNALNPAGALPGAKKLTNANADKAIILAAKELQKPVQVKR
jgi:hypothetical protein